MSFFYRRDLSSAAAAPGPGTKEPVSGGRSIRAIAQFARAGWVLWTRAQLLFKLDVLGYYLSGIVFKVGVLNVGVKTVTPQGETPDVVSSQL